MSTAFPSLSLGLLRNVATRYVQGNPQYRGYDILPLLSALNIVLAAYPNRSGPGGGVLVGRNRYFFPGAAPPVPLGGGLEAWRGFFTSVRPNFKSLMVNVNGKCAMLGS